MKTTSSTIIIGLVLLMLGIGLGFMLGVGERPQPIEIPANIPAEVQDALTPQERKVLTLLKSETVEAVRPDAEFGFNVFLIGYIAEIGEDAIVIAYEQDELELNLFQYVHINRELPQEDLEIELAEIQKGEMVKIHAIVTEKGELVAKVILVQ